MNQTERLILARLREALARKQVSRPVLQQLAADIESGAYMRQSTDVRSGPR